MANPQHVAWLKEGVAKWNARRQSQRFDPDLSSEDISRALGGHDREDIRQISVHLSRVNLSGANLSDSTLRDTDLTGAKFYQAKLTRANLTGSDFTGVQFIGGTSRGAHFHSAKFFKTLFLQHELTAAQFNGAELQETRFLQCSLNQAEMLNHLYNETLASADFILSRPWSALLYWPSANTNVGSGTFDQKEIGSINDLLDRCREFRQIHGDEVVLYFRGESRCFPELRPSVMRMPQSGEAPLRSVEAEMLNDLITRQPEAFNALDSTLARWVLAQHHQLRTRLLDITRNPLVALYNACDSNGDEDGRVHVFGVPRSLIKPFNSDTVSIISSFAKLPRAEQNILLGKTQIDAPDDVFSTNIADYLIGTDPFAKAKTHLYSVIRQEKPHFEERIDIRDLFRVFVVEPQRNFERLRAQSGAFLVSAFHERFERNEILRWNKHIPTYSHFLLNLPQAQKESLLDDLRLLNVTREVLYPSVDEAASAVTQQYLNRTD